jgi:hypothetical protein
MTTPIRPECGPALTPDELYTLKNPPVSVTWWGAYGTAQKLVDAGLLAIKTRERFVPAHTVTYADFVPTDAGNAVLQSRGPDSQ